MDNDTNTQQTTQSIPPEQTPVNPATATQASDVSVNSTPTIQVSNASANPTPTSQPVDTTFRSFTNLKTWGIVMGVLDIISVLVMFPYASVVIVFMGIASSNSDSTGMTVMIPILLLPITMSGLLIYSAYLSLTLKKTENNFPILKRHIIISAIISIFSPFWLFVIIADIIVFVMLLPKYEQALSVTTQSTQPTPSTSSTQPIQSTQPTPPPASSEN